MDNLVKLEGGIPGFDNIINGFIDNNIRYYTIQFFKKTGADTFAPEGTGVLVHIFNVFCVFTASHVIENLEDKNLLYFRYGPEKYISSSGIIRVSDYKISKNHPDIAYIILEKEVIEQLGKIGLKFLKQNKVLPFHKGLQVTQYAIYGFPTDFVKIENDIMINGGNLFIGPMANDKPYTYYNYSKDTHFIMPYTNPRNISTNEKTETRPIYGMSGSGLWFISVTKILDEYTYDYHLIGIMNEFKTHGKYQIIVGNKINLITDQLFADISES
ncbi:MAG: hypothetical protein KA270_00905 [Saprospiraceae bacterium]|nr:hypothetical protein [Saprospiraceae bacterium]MBP6565688.1 hypothetical protein [Saprospiraceae bacterium]